MRVTASLQLRYNDGMAFFAEFNNTSSFKGTGSEIELIFSTLRPAPSSVPIDQILQVPANAPEWFATKVRQLKKFEVFANRSGIETIHIYHDLASERSYLWLLDATR